ncbi:FixH family protein [Noviherbaspirillum sp.]|jgi:hypothetical protein|uniref:FixH family protein n=1 Tax=Noviherbaspirillum sp. TaxID=1926288 RepID=UPI0025FC5F47|nr:FixH family protein [Noviherbaspirillum sp.]
MQSTASVSNRINPSKPWYRHPWPWLLMLGPLVVVMAGSYTAWLAFTRQDALVVDDYYKQGKAINQDLRRDRVAASMRLKLNIRYDAAAGILSGTISNLAQPDARKLELSLLHSTLPSKDMRLEVRPDAHGNFSIALPMLDVARWQVLVEGEQRDWRLNGVWSWPHEREVEIRAEAS